MKTRTAKVLLLSAMTMLLANCAKSEDAAAATSSSSTLSSTPTNPSSLETSLCTGGTLTSVANNGTITGTQTGCVDVAAGNTAKISGTVKFPSGTIFRIGAGATIQGDTASATVSYLVIDRGAAIKAVGTAAQPITFTSDKTAGTRASGDWGGIVINGKARINAGGGEADGEGDSGKYGGLADTDNSGTMQYVRIQFGGRIFSGTNELNGIALQGVGSGTTIDHIQIHKGKDDGIEFFGGTVNVKYLVSTANEDDQVDWTNGYTGKLQFVVAAPVGAGTDTGFEMDNNETNFSATPVANPTIYNVTVVKGSDGNINKRGMRFRRGTRAKLRNAYIANVTSGSGWSNNQCITLEDTETNIDIGTGTSILIERCSTTGYTITAGTMTNAASIVVADAPGTPWLNFGTTLNSQANLAADTTGAVFVKQAGTTSAPTAVDPTLEGSFFTAGTFVGAINTGDNWQTTGGTWVAFPAN